jgi:hypothetical protein
LRESRLSWKYFSVEAVLIVNIAHQVNGALWHFSPTQCSERAPRYGFH